MSRTAWSMSMGTAALVAGMWMAFQSRRAPTVSTSEMTTPEETTSEATTRKDTTGEAAAVTPGVALERGVEREAPRQITSARTRDRSLLKEDELMSELRDLQFSDPEASLALAQEGNTRFPDSPEAAERAWWAARALVHLQRFEEARTLAREMLERYPDAHWTRDVRRHLLSHPFGLPPRAR